MIKGKRIEDEGVIEPKLFHTIATPNMHLATFSDDFMAGTLATNVWTSGGTSGATTIVTGGGGTAVADTTATGNRTATLTFDGADFDSTYPFGMEFRAKTNVITNQLWIGGFYKDSDEYAYFKFNTASSASTIYCSINTAAGDISADSGIDAAADTYHVYRIEIDSDRYVQYYVDDQKVEDSRNFTTATKLMTTAGISTHVPYFYIDNKDQSQDNHLIIDYVKVWQLRDKAAYSYTP